jgi:hypothetical protein
MNSLLHSPTPAGFSPLVEVATGFTFEENNRKEFVPLLRSRRAASPEDDPFAVPPEDLLHEHDAPRHFTLPEPRAALLQLRKPQDRMLTVHELREDGSVSARSLLRSALLQKAQEKARQLFGTDRGTVRIRDLRLLDGQGEYECSIVSRLLCLLVNLPPVRAVVLHDRLLLLSSEDDVKSALAGKLAAQQAEANGGPRLDFQVAALEAILATTMHALEAQFKALQRDARLVTLHPASISLDRLVDVQTRAHRLQLHAGNYLAALDGLLQDDLGMVSFVRIIANPMRFAEHAVDALAPSEQMEMAVEVWLDTVSSLHADIAELVEDVQNAARSKALNLQLAQNRFIMMQVLLQSVTASCALPMFVTGTFAMNLLAGINSLSVGLFWGVCAFCLLVLVGGSSGCMAVVRW